MNRTDRATKRAVDVAVATVALAVSSPLLAAIAVVVRRTSDGPALFRQERVGLAGRPFEILKFRTMTLRPAAELGLAISPAGDARVTRVGRVLRASKLDELPQLLNVLRGEMSLVGPRPEVAHYVELWPAREREIILSVRPGITDPASVAFAREGEILAAADDPERCYVEEILPRKVEMYVDYVRTASLRGDARILLSTIGVLRSGTLSPRRSHHQ